MCCVASWISIVLDWDTGSGVFSIGVAGKHVTVQLLGFWRGGYNWYYMSVLGSWFKGNGGSGSIYALDSLIHFSQGHSTVTFAGATLRLYVVAEHLV